MKLYRNIPFRRFVGGITAMVLKQAFRSFLIEIQSNATEVFYLQLVISCHFKRFAFLGDHGGRTLADYTTS